MPDCHKAALRYNELGFSVIPVDNRKRPLIKWEQYQRERADIAQIDKWWGKHPNAGVGIVTGQISGLYVLDIDDQDEASEWLSEHLPEQLETVESYTPSGGQHIWFAMPDKELRNTARVIPGCDTRGEGGYIVAPPSVNGRGSYSFKPGLKPGAVHLCPLPLSIISYLYNTKSLYRENIEHEGVVVVTKRMFEKGTRDNDLFNVANTLLRGGMPGARATQVLEILGKNCNPPFDKAELDTKISSAMKRKNTRESKLSDDIREWISSSNGVFSSQNVINELHLSSHAEKRNARNILGRLIKEGLIERHGNKAGQYRIIDSNINIMDFTGPKPDPLKIYLPLDLHKYVRLFRKNVGMLAGVKSSGKSAFALNTAFLNRDFAKNNPGMSGCSYASSEMAQEEMFERLELSDMPLDEWKKIRFLERAGDFHDIIDPNGFNVIDFLEIHDEFYRVGGMIRQIYDRLENGIAIIALQKNPGAEVGLGGWRSIEKARLYLNFERNQIEIKEIKAWKGDKNPRGCVRDFKLVRGYDFLPTNEWHEPEGSKPVLGYETL